MALEFRKLRISALPCVGTGKRVESQTRATRCAWRSAVATPLTGFEGHDAFQTGKLCGIQAHLSESGDHLLKGLDLRHDFRHPLGLCVFSVHAYEEEQSPGQDAPTAVRVCPARLLTRNSQKSGGVDGNGPLRDAQDKQLPPSILQENQLHRESGRHSQ